MYYVVYNQDGKNYPAYCLNQDLNGVSNDFNYSIIGKEKLSNEKIWRAIINGYPYKSLESLGVQNEHEAYTATKVAVYAMMYDRNIEDHAPVDSEAGRRTYNAFVQIVNNARNSTETIKDLSMKIVPINNWEVDNINSEYVSKTYSVNNNLDIGSYDISIDGNLPEGSLLTDLNNNVKSSFEMNEKFKILIPIKNLVHNDNFKITAKTNLETKPVVYGKSSIPGTQDYAIAGFWNDESSNEFSDSFVKNVTKVIIKKQEYGTDKALSGVKFNLLDKNNNLIIEDLETDENGLITVENVIPGTYYLKETETLEGYNLYTDLIEVKIGLNEEMQIVVNNTLAKEKEINKSFETVKVTEKNEENVFKNQNNLTEENISNTQNIKNEENISNTQTIINEQNNSTQKNIAIENANIQKTNEVKKLPKTGF